MQYLPGVKDSAWPLCLSDALGLGAFTVLGARSAAEAGRDPLICVACGLVTATFGGIIRDVLCRKPVRLLHGYRSIYGTPAIIGSAVFMAVRILFPEREGTGALMGLIVTVLLRVLAWTYYIRLPAYLSHPAVDGKLRSRAKNARTSES